MMAAVLHEVGGIPRYEEFPDPVAGEDEVIVDVKAVAVENVDKMVAPGTHYASSRYISQLPTIPGFDGVGTLPDGTLVGFGNPRPPYGAPAAKTVVASNAVAPIPVGLDAATAVVLATAITGLSIKTAAGFVPGETVLIQGATGVSGKLAVKVARLLGAGRIVCSGREEALLQSLPALGASQSIDLKQPDEAICEAFTRESGEGYDVILDFLWGHPTELLFRALTPTAAGFAKHRTRYVQIGQAAGAAI